MNGHKFCCVAIMVAGDEGVGERRSIDLHGLTVNEALRRFVRFYNDCVRQRVKGPIEVVHGYGATSEGGGEIRRELRGFLGAHEDRVAGWVAGDGIGNPGVTRVWVGKALAEKQG